MQIHLYDSAAQVGQAAATLIAAQIIAKPDSVLGLATGSTPIPTYQELIRLCKGGVLDFSRVRSFNLDEYCNLPVDHEQSYHSFMRDVYKRQFSGWSYFLRHGIMSLSHEQNCRIRRERTHEIFRNAL